MQSYQLHIRVSQAVDITIGRFGQCRFPAGLYTYTGSAKKNIYKRVQRHLGHPDKEKKLKWHIDYLLAHEFATIIGVRYCVRPECDLNQATSGDIVIPNFGSTDCNNNCGSHLKLKHILG